MLKVGLNAVRDAHSADIDKAWMGTDGTAPAESQTGLQSGTAATKLAVTIVATDKTNTVSYTLPSTTGTGSTYREFAVIDDGTVEYNRVTFTGIAHTAAEDIIVRQTFFYKNP